MPLRSLPQGPNLDTSGTRLRGPHVTDFSPFPGDSDRPDVETPSTEGSFDALLSSDEPSQQPVPAAVGTRRQRVADEQGRAAGRRSAREADSSRRSLTGAALSTALLGGAGLLAGWRTGLLDGLPGASGGTAGKPGGSRYLDDAWGSDGTYERIVGTIPRGSIMLDPETGMPIDGVALAHFESGLRRGKGFRHGSRRKRRRHRRHHDLSLIHISEPTRPY